MNLQGVEFDLAAIRTLATTAKVRSIYLFGSIIEGTFKAESDIDMLVELDRQAGCDLFDVVWLQGQLSQLLRREVHLTIIDSVPNRVIVELIKKAKPLHAA